MNGCVVDAAGLMFSVVTGSGLLEKLYAMRCKRPVTKTVNTEAMQRRVERLVGLPNLEQHANLAWLIAQICSEKL